MATALSEADTLEEVARVAVTRGRQLLEADRGALGLLTDDGDALELLEVQGYGEAIVGPFRRMPVDAAIPAAEAARERAPVWIESNEEYAVRYPDAYRDVQRVTGSAAVAALPLADREGLLGVLCLAFGSRRAIGMEDRALTLLLAQHMGTALRRARRQRDQEMDARTRRRARDDALAEVAHDLRSPLQLITVNAEILHRRAPLEEEDEKLVLAVARAARRMGGLIENVLDSAALERGRLSLDLAAEPVASLLEEAAEAYRPHAERAELSLSVDCPPGLPEVAVDRRRILRVLSNLLDNAIKFTPAGGSVELRAWSSHEETRNLVGISVRDTGPGIDPEDRAHLFERFWHGRAPAQREQGAEGPPPGVEPGGRAGATGSGLGLSICRGIVEAHGGRIWLESPPGRGATFSFTLPVSV